MDQTGIKVENIDVIAIEPEDFREEILSLLQGPSTHYEHVADINVGQSGSILAIVWNGDEMNAEQLLAFIKENLVTTISWGQVFGDVEDLKEDDIEVLI